MTTQRTRWFQVLRPISPRARLVFGSLSFVLPILVWSIVSYVPGSGIRKFSSPIRARSTICKSACG